MPSRLLTKDDSERHRSDSVARTFSDLQQANLFSKSRLEIYQPGFHFAPRELDPPEFLSSAKPAANDFFHWDLESHESFDNDDPRTSPFLSSLRTGVLISSKKSWVFDL